MPTFPPNDPDRPVAWALVGASSIAAAYMIDALRRAPGGRLVGVLSSDPERGARFAQRHGIPRPYRSREELCADAEVEAVYVSTANDRHAPDTIAALEAGKAVLCEKPLAVVPADAEAMIAAAQRTGVTLGVNHHLRCAPANRKARELLAGGRIGQVLGARVFHGTELPVELRTWRTTRPSSGAGAALDLTVHGIDLLRFLLDDEIVGVTACRARQGVSEHPEIEDAIAGALCFGGGALATFHDAFTLPRVRTSVELYGSTGSIRIEDALLDDPVATLTLLDAEGTHAIAVDDDEGLYERAVRRFNAAVRGRGKPSASGEDGLRSLLVACAALESAREGRAVRIGDPT